MALGSAAVIALAATSAACAQLATHADEIRFFASLMAIAQTVDESCSGMKSDDYFLEDARLHLHVVEPTFARQARAAANVLAQARDQAPSRHAWCYAVFRLYGPNGSLIQGMLR